MIYIFVLPEKGLIIIIIITEEEGQEWADKIKALKFIECSALTRENVDLIFKEAAKQIYNKKKASIPNEGCCFSIFKCC